VKRNEGCPISKAEGEHSETTTEASLGVVIETREPFNLGTPRSLIRGIIHHPGIARKVSKRKEHLSDHLGTEEEKQFSPAATGLVEETVNGVFSFPGKDCSGNGGSQRSFSR